MTLIVLTTYNEAELEHEVFQTLFSLLSNFHAHNFCQRISSYWRHKTMLNYLDDAYFI